MKDLPVSVPSENAFPDLCDLSEEAYVVSLTASAAKAGLFSADDQNALQAGLYAGLCELASRVGKGKSSSLRIERAEELLQSILFAVGAALKKDSPAAAVERLKTTSVRTLFAEGQGVIKRKLLVCRAMHKRLCKHLFDTPNEFYVSTVSDGIAGFFKLYEPLSGGHEWHITADYPTCLGRPKAAGIEFIESYLWQLSAENDFLRLFEPQKVAAFLEKQVPGYAQVPMNLFEPVIARAALLASVGRNPLEICDIPEKKELLPIADEAFCKAGLQRLSESCELSETMRQYLELCQPHLITEMQRQATLCS